MKTLVIIPAFNEEANIESVVEKFNKDCPECDYVVINDGSTDKTAEILDKNEYNHIDLCCNLGIGGCVQCGYLYAYENNYDCAVQMDADGQHDSAYINAIVSPIEKGEADVVIGSRFITNEGFQSSAMRRFGIGFLSKLILLVSKADVKDVTSGFRAVNRKFIKLFSENYADDYPEPEAIVLSKINGAIIKEVPVIMHEREGGKSSIGSLSSIYYMIKVSLAIIFNRFMFKGGAKK